MLDELGKSLLSARMAYHDILFIEERELFTKVSVCLVHGVRPEIVYLKCFIFVVLFSLLLSHFKCK